MNKIFELENLRGLSKGLISELKTRRFSEDSRKFLSLFEIEEELSIDHILVGMARKYKLNKKRLWVISTIFNLKKAGLIEVVENKKQTYRTVK